MRGISSIARKSTPRGQGQRGIRFSAVSGSPKPITVCPLRRSARSAAPVSGLAPGRTDLKNHVRFGEDLLAFLREARALLDVIAVRVACALTGAPLHHDPRPSLGEHAQRARDEGDAAFTRGRFRNYSDYE